MSSIRGTGLVIAGASAGALACCILNRGCARELAETPQPGETRAMGDDAAMEEDSPTLAQKALWGIGDAAGAVFRWMGSSTTKYKNLCASSTESLNRHWSEFLLNSPVQQAAGSWAGLDAQQRAELLRLFINHLKLPPVDGRIDVVGPLVLHKEEIEEMDQMVEARSYTPPFRTYLWVNWEWQRGIRGGYGILKFTAALNPTTGEFAQCMLVKTTTITHWGT